MRYSNESLGEILPANKNYFPASVGPGIWKTSIPYQLAWWGKGDTQLYVKLVTVVTQEGWCKGGRDRIVGALILGWRLSGKRKQERGGHGELNEERRYVPGNP